MFRPQLRCKQGTRFQRHYHRSYVSKLMKKAEAEREISNIKALSDATKGIPNMGDYIVGFSDRSQTGEVLFDCPPAPLGAADLATFDECTSPSLGDYRRSNVNWNLNQLRILNSPYGGINLVEAFRAVIDNPNAAPAAGLTIGLRGLLLNGIVPMNKRGMIHGDIKDANVLVDVLGEEFASGRATPEGIVRDLRGVSGSPPSPAVRARLIDWGQMIDARPTALGTSGFPQKLADGMPIMWNCPVSIILFADGLQDEITTTVRAEARPISISVDTSISAPARAAVMRNLAVKLYGGYRKMVGGVAHDMELQRILSQFYAPLPVGTDSPCSPESVIVRYLTEVLDKYVGPDNQFMRKEYFQEVLSKNIDVYGLVMCYLPVLEGKAGSLSHAASRAIRDMIITYCFSPAYAATPISVAAVSYDMHRIGTLIDPHMHRRGAFSVPSAPRWRKRPASRQSSKKRAAKTVRRASAPALVPVRRRTFKSARLTRSIHSAPNASPKSGLTTRLKRPKSAPGRQGVPGPRPRPRKASGRKSSKRFRRRSLSPNFRQVMERGRRSMRGPLRMPIGTESPSRATRRSVKRLGQAVGLVSDGRGVRLTALPQAGA